jgi:hypothetical protein
LQLGVRFQQAKPASVPFGSAEQRLASRIGCPTTKGSANCARSSGIAAAGRTRKKTAAAIHTEITREVNRLLACVFAERPHHSRRDLEAIASSAAPSRVRRPDRTAPVRSAGHRPTPTAVPLRPPRAISGVTFQTGAQRGRSGEGGAALLPVCALPSRAVSGRCGVGYCGYRILPRRAPHACPGRSTGAFRSWPRADAGAGRLGSDHQSVERTAEAIGGDIAERQPQEIHRAVQLDLPIVVGEPIPMYEDFLGRRRPPCCKAAYRPAQVRCSGTWKRGLPRLSMRSLIRSIVPVRMTNPIGRRNGTAGIVAHTLRQLVVRRSPSAEEDPRSVASVNFDSWRSSAVERK